jgi:serine/threonine-protein kinase
MEQLRGQTLGARLDQGPMDRRDAIAVLLELCDVLRAAHAAGVVHRDLKLDNVFLLATPCSGGRHIKLLDWGVASILGEPDPLQDMIAGTLTYVAPEQVRGDELTPASDVYALAVVAYQLLFNEPPFASPQDLELLRKHLHEPPPAPSSLWQGIPTDLEALLLGMLAKRAEDRPMLDAVTQVLTLVRTTLAPAAPKRTWLRLSHLPAIDVLGRPALGLLPSRHRLLGVALAIVTAALSFGSPW